MSVCRIIYAFAFRSPSTRATVKKAQGVTAAPSGASPFPGVYANGQGQALPVPYAPSSLAPDRKSFKSRVVLGWTCRTKQGMGYSVYFIEDVFKRRPAGLGIWLARSTRQLAATPDSAQDGKRAALRAALTTLFHCCRFHVRHEDHAFSLSVRLFQDLLF